MSRSPKMQKRSFLWTAVAGLVLFALTVACDSPTAPSRNPTAPSQPRIEPSPNRPDLSGTYTLALSASSRCRLELPEEFRTQTYAATIGQEGGSLVVSVHHSRFPGWDIGRFTGVFGETGHVIFQMGLEDWFAGAEYQAAYYASGSMTGAIVEEGLSGILDGVVETIVPNEDGRGNRVVRCTAPDHSAVFSR